jgi:hypothetical protein
MKKTTAPAAEIAVVEELPVRVQEALGELASAARDGLLALSVGVGLGVLAELMEEEVVEVVGAKGKHDPGRVAVRHGREAGEVTLGGRRVAVERPRVRSADGSSELPLATYRHFADRDLLTRVVLERMLAGVSTRRYRRTQEPVGEEVEQRACSISKSSISRAFVGRTRKALSELMARRLDDVRLAGLMLDGVELKGRTNIVCLGVTTEGVKIPLGLWEGSTENATVATALLADLVERGLDPGQGMLFVIDGSKALRKAIRDVFGEQALVQRCLRHKEQNGLAGIRRGERALQRARDPEPGERERLVDPLTQRGCRARVAALQLGSQELEPVERLLVLVQRPCLPQATLDCRPLALGQVLQDMIECVRRTSRNVKRWQSGEMCLRWTAAGMLEAERQFRRIIGYRNLAKLCVAIERDPARQRPPQIPVAEAATATR